MKITINGKIKNFDAPSSLEAVIAQMCKDTRHVLAELNGQIIQRPAWAKTDMQDGDKVELVSFVGGG